MKPTGGLLALLASMTVGLLMLVMSVTAASGDGGVLEGRLRNGTAGASIPTGLEVTVATAGKAGSPDAVQKTKVDEQGVFRFTSLDATSGYTYTVTTTYQEVEYRSAPATFAAGETTKQTELIVYEATESDAALSVEVAHTVLEPDPQNQAVWAVEAAVIVNNGDRTYAGNRQQAVDGKRVTLLFSWPEGSGHLQPMQGLDADTLVELTNGFGDTAPVLPGKREVGYTYMLPVQDGAVSFARALDYPTKRFTALVVDTGGRIDGGTLTKGDPADVDGKRYQVFTAQNLAPGTPIALRLSGLVASRSTSTSMLLIAVGAMALAAVIGLTIYIWRRRSANVSPVLDVESEVVRSHREQLLADLAELDDSFEAGEIDEDEYQATRADRKRQLAALWQVRVEG